MTARVAMVLVGLGLIAGQGRAGIVTFVGEDLQLTADPTVRTNSDAAAASFLSAAASLGPVGTFTFESAPLGSFHNLAVAPGVTISGSDADGNDQTIRDTSNFPTDPSLDGSNINAGGSHFVELQGGTLVLTFDQPTQFFGAYFTGVQTDLLPDTISFNDGSSQSITLAGLGTSPQVGEIAFVGFTDAGKSITTVAFSTPPTLKQGKDFLGSDNIWYQSPEPSSLIISSILLGVFGVVALRKQSDKPERAAHSLTDAGS